MTKKILIIDDIKEVREDLRTVLMPEPSAEEQMGMLLNGAQASEPKYEIDDVESGELGVEYVRKAYDSGSPYDIAIVDMKMPAGIDGIETIRRIRQVDKGVHVIICTSYTDVYPEAAAQYNDGETPPVVSKPLDSSWLIRAVEEGSRRR